ncbi:endonuclease I [Nocardioides albertanoniae]|uniref:Endonuclease I n=2 Tax=Nocardioides albertanoniae TaxID=1175486 RepID=A0A543A6C2_9ACTN|nr:endonuclease I [Nocardioides albertanoniae]
MRATITGMPFRRSRLRRLPASLLTLATATTTAVVITTAPAQAAVSPTDQAAAPSTSSEIPSGYYDPADGLSGEELKTALNGIIDDHTTLSYDQVWDALKDVDEDPANPDNVITVYSQLSLPKSSNGGDPDQWNREHTWAKSHGDFGTSAGPGTDIHHLMPEDVSVNSTRGNLDFDETTGSVDQCTGCGVDDDSFAPPAETRGDIARAMFYMAVRYEGTDSYVDLELNDQVDNGSAPYIGKLSVLKAWSEADPPSEFEINRNDKIYADWQGNRNPFVDHPEWVEEIW